MSTALAPPPMTGPRSGRGGAPARRAIRRWAWRLLRREWRQQVLVLALLTVAVATTTVGLGLVVNVQGTDQSVFGTADARVEIAKPGPQGVARDVAAARAQFGKVEAIVHENLPVPGSITPVDLRGQDPQGAFGKPMLRVVSGQYPSGAGQAAVTAAVATTFDLKVGSTWPVNGRSLRVVGIVENPHNLQDAFGLVPPAEVANPSTVTLLFDATGSQALKFRAPAGAGTVQGVMASGADAAQQKRNQATAVLLLATIGLTFVGLLSVAGFTVMAHRRLRALGMIGAIGATDRQVRQVMLANGVAVGTAGAASGVALGLVVWLALTPAFENVVGHRYDPFALPWWAVCASVILAILTTLAASWWPARAAAKLSIVSALSGRPAPPQPAHRFALLGTVLAATGFVALILSHGVHPVLIVAGILATTAGMLLLAPLGIRALAAVASHAPIAVRLALRDLARYQSRSGAALAAASLAVGIAATVAVTAAAQQAHDHTLTGGNLPTNQLIVWLANPNAQDGGPGLSVARISPGGAATGAPAVPNRTVVAKDQSTADAIAHAIGSTTVVELDAAVDLSTLLPAGAPPDADQATLVHPITVAGRGHGWTQVATPYVATPAVLSLYHLPPGDLAASSDVLSSRLDLSGTEIGTGFTGDFRPVTVQTSALLPNYTSAPNTLLTPKAMTANGYTGEPVGWLVQAKEKITSAQITAARLRAAAGGITIEARTGPDRTLQHLRDYSTVAGMLVALGVLAMTVGLIRSETAGDLRTLAAAGASGRTRRTLNAASAGALALLGGILGTATAYLALIAWHWHNISYLNKPPYPNLAILVLGLPVVASAGAWLLGRTPKSLGHRSLE
jgi:putative ABC transport system permease protein